MKALIIRDLKKSYAGNWALKGIDLEVEQGDFFALLGPNGAGKSTTIGIVTSLVNKTSGFVSVFGHDIAREPTLAKSFIGLVPQEFNFNLFETVFDIVVNQAGFYGIPPATPALTCIRTHQSTNFKLKNLKQNHPVTVKTAVTSMF